MKGAWSKGIVADGPQVNSWTPTRAFMSRTLGSHDPSRNHPYLLIYNSKSRREKPFFFFFFLPGPGLNQRPSAFQPCALPTKPSRYTLARPSQLGIYTFNFYHRKHNCYQWLVGSTGCILTPSSWKFTIGKGNSLDQYMYMHCLCEKWARFVRLYTCNGDFDQVYHWNYGSYGHQTWCGYSLIIPLYLLKISYHPQFLCGRGDRSHQDATIKTSYIFIVIIKKIMWKESSRLVTDNQTNRVASCPAHIAVRRAACVHELNPYPCTCSNESAVSTKKVAFS